MTFPHINTKATHYDLTAKIEDYLEKRLKPLEKFIADDETAVGCDVELQKVLEQQHGKIYRAEINLKVGGKLYRAEATEETMEAAIDIAKNEVKKEIRRANKKGQSLAKRGARKAKDFLRFGK